MQNNKPTFSIVMPIYNEERFIEEALDSILAQTDPDWEAILVDDGSIDATPEILDRYAKNDQRFRVFHKPNGGQSTAINKGVEEARGEWLCWLSGDDFFHPQKLELNRKWIQDYPEKKFFFSGHWLIEPDGKKIEYNLDWLDLENSAYHLITLFRCNYVMGISICINHESWVKTGGFDEKLRHAHDLDMWLRLMLTTHTQYLPDRTCTMRYHPGQETARFPLAPLFDVAKSAIRVINDHPFPDLFPGVDLSDQNMAIDMLLRALNFVASEPTSNYYALGFHPALQFRILEWIWDPKMDPILAKELKTLLRKRINDITAYHSITPFNFIWKAVAAVLDFDQPCFVYQSCDPARIGEINYYYQFAGGKDVAQPLRTYLERYDGVHFADRSDPELPGRELVILLPFELMLDDCQEPQYQDYMDFFQYLIEAGHTLLLVGNSHNNIGITNGLLYLGAEREEDLKTLVSGLGNLDAVVNMSRLDNLHWIKSKHLISINLPSKELSETEIQKTLLGKIQSELAKSASPLEAKPENDPFWTKANHNLDHFLSRFKSFISKH